MQEQGDADRDGKYKNGSRGTHRHRLTMGLPSRNTSSQLCAPLMYGTCNTVVGTCSRKLDGR